MNQFYLGNRMFRVDENTNISIELISDIDKVSEYRISIKLDEPTYLKNVVIRWYEPMLGILSVWLPKKGKSRDRALLQWFYKSHDSSSFCSGAPILCACDRETNFQTFALSDAENCHDLAFFVDDFVDEGNVCMQLSLFEKKTLVKEYSTILRIDSRKIPFYDAIKGITKWWSGFYNRQIFNTEYAEYPLYSAWYNFHQHPNAELLEKELEIAKDLGFKTIILDDGWQYDGNGTGDYFNCGLWEVSKEKFPDFKGFVDKVHLFGMQIAVWFPVPYVGYNTTEYQKLKDKLLYNSDFSRAGIVDPRYPEVRKYLVDIFSGFMLKYALDGLKLDFVDDFKTTDETPAYNENMDFKDVNGAVEQLLVDIASSLKKINPDVLIEFRQNYVGPSIVRFCNMLRVGDCAFDSLTNRIAVTDLRMPEYDLAVHSDMLYWAREESLDNIKKQLLNVLFSVPQVSVLLTESSPNQIELLKNHLKYWNDNKDIILHGHFKTKNLEHNYPIISSENESKRIVVLHDVYTYSNFDKNVDIFNAGIYSELYLDFDKEVKATIYDMMEKELYSFKIEAGVSKINVPVGGRIEVRL